MPSKQKLDKLYIDIAFRIAEMSSAERLKVGSVFVQGHSIISYGYNGTPHGFHTNIAEVEDAGGGLVTRPELIHAEQNGLLKLLRSNIPSKEITVYCTDSPCIQCAIHMYQSQVVKEFVYVRKYRITDGIDFLKNHGVVVRQIDKETAEEIIN